jgi:hypothetical protein
MGDTIELSFSITQGPDHILHAYYNYDPLGIKKGDNYPDTLIINGRVIDKIYLVDSFQSQKNLPNVYLKTIILNRGHLKYPFYFKDLKYRDTLNLDLRNYAKPLKKGFSKKRYNLTKSPRLLRSLLF